MKAKQDRAAISHRRLSGWRRFTKFLFNAHLTSLVAGACMVDAVAHEGTHTLARQSATARGGDFTLDSVNGSVSLKQFPGKAVIIYFGYTFCPDACPTTLSALGEAMKRLTPAEAEHVQPLFITLDPQRDDVKRLQDYGRFFFPTVIGLRGNDAKLGSVAKQYGVLYKRQKVDSAANYVIDHSSFLYVVGPDGKLKNSLPHGTSVTDIAAALRSVLPARKP